MERFSKFFLLGWIQISTYIGYGCSCEESETVFGIRYDYWESHWILLKIKLI